MEVTGAVNLAEKFPGALPPEADQDAFIKDACTRMTDAYLAPVQLRTTTLTLIYSTISLPSWSAGSHQVACSIGATLGNGGWATLLNSAKGPLLINGQPPVPPPDIPPSGSTCRRSRCPIRGGPVAQFVVVGLRLVRFGRARRLVGLSLELGLVGVVGFVEPAAIRVSRPSTCPAARRPAPATRSRPPPPQGNTFNPPPPARRRWTAPARRRRPPTHLRRLRQPAAGTARGTAARRPSNSRRRPDPWPCG